MLKCEIEGGNLPVVICYPEAGQTICTERGSMSWMSANMDMQTNTGGGLKKALGRLFAGESLFLNEYTPMGGPGMIAFASSFPGRVITDISIDRSHYEVKLDNGLEVEMTSSGRIVEVDD